MAITAFPEQFRWGAATAAHQYEGFTKNQWSRWEAQGHIKSGDSSGAACNWWNIAEEDFQRAKDLHLNALRISLEWSRIEPIQGQWDDAALRRYRSMLEALRNLQIEPLVTLHHFTHPIWFEDMGGFLSPKATEYFERYVTKAVETLGDLCDFWITMNEPNVYAVFGYLIGDFPPGRQGDIRSTLLAQAGMARAHAAAYRAIHRIQPSAKVSWAQHINIFDPANQSSPLDRWSSRQQDLSFNGFFLRAIETGSAEWYIRPFVGDMSMVKQTADYIGLNIYARNTVRFNLSSAGELFGKRETPAGAPLGDPGISANYGEIYPQGILRAAQRVARFRLPIYITENGVADRADRLRPWVIAQAVCAMHDALEEGIDLRGYYHWSLVDNFEWAEGWTMRFGLYALDTETQGRTLRPSGELYAEIARMNGYDEKIHGIARHKM